MGSFVIEGGQQLSGSITPQGAKNEALQILCAVLLTAEPVNIHNIPDIIDVNKLIQLLRNFGVKVTPLEKGAYRFQAYAVDLSYLESEQFKADGKGLRGSIMLVGPLLARFGKGSIPRPGGDKIGRRRLDTHFEGLLQLLPEPPTSLWQLFWQKAPLRSTMPLANPICNSCVLC